MVPRHLSTSTQLLHTIMSTNSVPGGKMHLVIFGAAGQTGIEIIKQALAAGYQVTAASRRSTSLPSQEGLAAVAVDINDASAVEVALKGADVAISTLGVQRSNRQPACHALFDLNEEYNPCDAKVWD